MKFVVNWITHNYALDEDISPPVFLCHYAVKEYLGGKEYPRGFHLYLSTTPKRGYKKLWYQILRDYVNPPVRIGLSPQDYNILAMGTNTYFLKQLPEDIPDVGYIYVRLVSLRKDL